MRGGPSASLGLRTPPLPATHAKARTGLQTLGRRRWKWADVRRWLTDQTGRWKPITADGIELFNPTAIPITRYRYWGNKIPNPWAQPA